MRKLLCVLVAGTLFLGACSDDGDGGPDPSEDPKEALIEAFQDLTEGDGISMTMSIASDEESLQAMAADGGDEIPDDVASTILDSSITIAGNNATSPEDSQVEMTFDLGGEEAFAMVIDGYDLYAHADVPYIMETFGQDPAALDQQLAQLPPGMEFVNDAVNNEWIHLTGLEQLAQQAEQSGQAGVPNLTEQQQQLVDDLAQTLEENSEVTEGDEEGPGTHLEASVDVQAFLEDFQQIAGELGQFGAPGMTQTPDVPEGTELILDAWVEDGSLTQIEFDFLKNVEALGESEDEIPEGVNELGFVVAFDEFDGEVEVPDDATEVSFEQIFSALMGGAFGSTGTDTGTGGATGTEEICAAVAELPKAQQAAYKDICPDL